MRSFPASINLSSKQSIKSIIFSILAQILIMGLYIIIGVFGILILHILFQGWYIRGEILNGYFFIDKNKEELYLINNYGNMYFSRFSGSGEIDRMFVEKFDLKTLNRQFEKKLASSTGEFLKNDQGQIIGLNDKFLYFGLGDHFLQIINMQTGENMAKKKDILAMNPEMGDFNVSECEYSGISKTLLIKSNDSFYALDPKSLRLKPLNSKPKKDETGIDLPQLGKIATMEFHQMRFTGAQYRDFYATGNLEFHCSEEPGTIRMYIDFSWKGHKGAVPKGEKTNFLYPNIISYHNDEYDSVMIDTPTIMVAHTPELNAPAREIRISAVQKGSRELWSHTTRELFIKPRYGKYNKLSYFEMEKSILFMMQTGKPHRISMSIVDNKTGKILQEPMRSINRRFLKI